MLYLPQSRSGPLPRLDRFPVRDSTTTGLGELEEEAPASIGDNDVIQGITNGFRDTVNVNPHITRSFHGWLGSKS